MAVNTFYHRLGEQISKYSKEVLPEFVRELQERMQLDPGVEAPQTHVQRMAQSDRGHENPGPGKKSKKLLK